MSDPAGQGRPATRCARTIGPPAGRPCSSRGGRGCPIFPRRGGEGMPPTTRSLVDAGWWSRLSSVVLPVTIVGAILVFVVPVPPGVLDLLLSANVTLAVLVLLTTLAISTPQEFSAF